MPLPHLLSKMLYLPMLVYSVSFEPSFSKSIDKTSSVTNMHSFPAQHLMWSKEEATQLKRLFWNDFLKKGKVPKKKDFAAARHPALERFDYEQLRGKCHRLKARTGPKWDLTVKWWCCTHVHIATQSTRKMQMCTGVLIYWVAINMWAANGGKTGKKSPVSH